MLNIKRKFIDLDSAPFINFLKAGVSFSWHLVAENGILHWNLIFNLGLHIQGFLLINPQSLSGCLPALKCEDLTTITRKFAHKKIWRISLNDAQTPIQKEPNSSMF